jgi:hypothetical protein
MDNTIIVVNNEPYCIWDHDLKGRNNEFLESIDVEYFDYVLNTHLSTEDEKRAAVSLRMSFHHVLETMFSLLGSYVQAPDCAYAWIIKCSTTDLREVVRRVNQGDKSLFAKLKLTDVSWQAIAELIFCCYMPSTEKNKITIELFARLWQRLAYEFLDQDYIDEYNSLKHGFRIRAGGFALAVGLEHQYGVPPPADEMKLIGKSEYGSSFFKLEPIGPEKKNRSLRSRRISLNWKIEKITLLIQLISMSINNITSALKFLNGYSPSSLKFTRPTEDDDFEKPWLYSPGVTRFNMDFTIDENSVVPTNRKELLERLKEKESQQIHPADPE